MVDRPPPQRYRIIERGGRLEVIDAQTGGRPQSAAERMAVHDAAHGHAALRYDRIEAAAEAATSAAQEKAAPSPDPIRTKLEAKPAPWEAKGEARPPRAKQPPSVAAPPTAGVSAGTGSPPFVTGKWWDSKGPRTITLGAAGRAKLTNSFISVVVMGIFIAVVMLLIQPLVLLVAAFALFRFGGTFLGPIGARLIDDAIKADARRGR